MKERLPNPLDLLKCRKLDYIPDYFETVDVQYSYNIVEAIDSWIQKNLKGRYAIKRAITESQRLSSQIKVGFENPTEASYFVLACPLLKYHN